MLTVAAPLVFGLPEPSLFSGADANFALHQVQAYTLAVRAGHWLPRWNPAGNGGFGAPVFYYYGRLPFLIAALVSVVLHLGPVGALLSSIALFHLLAFFTCRAWLRRHTGSRAADLGALTFIALPFAMLYNPLIRTGFAEIAATACVPLLFLFLERPTLTRAAWARQVAWLALVYAALAVTHLPQLVLGFAVVSLYALLLRGLRALAANVAGLLLGLLAAADSTIPAVRLQRLITPAAWVNDRYMDVRNNFLFSLARLHLMHTLIGELLLYATWLLCLGLAAALLLRPRKSRRALVIGVTLVFTLLAMTPIFWLLWVHVSALRALQFPWRLMPPAIALAAAAAALLTERRLRAQRFFLAALAVLIAVQLADAAGGAAIYLSAWGRSHPTPAVISWRVPKYVPWAQRGLPQATAPRSFPPEYIPAAASAAGWHIGRKQVHILPANGRPAQPPPLPAGLAESRDNAGNLILRGTLAAPAALDLPLFYFPDETVRGAAQTPVQLDPATGFATLSLPAGPVALTVTHARTLPAVEEGRAGSAAGCTLVLLTLLLVPASSRSAARRRQAHGPQPLVAVPRVRPAAEDAASRTQSPPDTRGPAAAPAHPGNDRPGT